MKRLSGLIAKLPNAPNSWTYFLSWTDHTIRGAPLRVALHAGHHGGRAGRSIACSPESCAAKPRVPCSILCGSESRNSLNSIQP
jgi:hypothetical protein